MSQIENTIKHAELGLTNTQNTIAFIDKKVAAGITMILVILGFIYPRNIVGATVVDICHGIIPLDWYAVIFMILLCMTGVTMGMALRNVYMTIFPRPPNRKGRWVLFPYSVGNADNEVLYKELNEKLGNGGMTEKEILDEFRDQLSILGDIQAKKMRHCKKTFGWLGGFVFCLVLVAAMAFFN